MGLDAFFDYATSTMSIKFEQTFVKNPFKLKKSGSQTLAFVHNFTLTVQLKLVTFFMNPRESKSKKQLLNLSNKFIFV